MASYIPKFASTVSRQPLTLSYLPMTCSSPANSVLVTAVENLGVSDCLVIKIPVTIVYCRGSGDNLVASMSTSQMKNLSFKVKLHWLDVNSEKILYK